MIKWLFIGLLATMPVLIFAQQEFDVSGKVGKVSFPAKVYLVFNNGNERAVDSTNVVDGAFYLKGTIKEPRQGILILDHEGAGIQALSAPDMISLFVEKGSIRVNSKDSLSNATLSGTLLNVDQQKLNTSLKTVNEKQKALMAAYMAATDEEKASDDFSSAIEAKYNAIVDETKAKQNAFIIANPKSFVSLTILLELAGDNPDVNEISPLLTGLSKELQSNPQAVALAEQLKAAQKLAIGAIAPVFTQNDTIGKPVSLESFKGKYVLLDFWASWCGPCRQENPNLLEAYNKFKDKNFTVIGISLDRPNGKDAWMKAIHDDKLAWTQVSDLKFWKNEVAQLYGIRAIPQNFLVDPNGKIVATNLRGEDLHVKLTELLD